MNENILILHEMGMISSADEREALDFCKKKAKLANTSAA